MAPQDQRPKRSSWLRYAAVLLLLATLTLGLLAALDALKTAHKTGEHQPPGRSEPRGD